MSEEVDVKAAKVEKNAEEEKPMRRAPEEEFAQVREGKASVLFKKVKNDVFYNPIQEFNRDLSIAALCKNLLSYLFSHSPY